MSGQPKFLNSYLTRIQKLLLGTHRDGVHAEVLLCHRQNMTQGLFLSWIHLVRIQNFPYSRLDA